VSKDAIFIFGCIITLWKVAREWAKRNVPVIGSVLLEVSSQGESLLETPEDALNDARGVCLVFHHMFLKVWSVSFDHLATELALKLLSIEFRGILLDEERFVIVQMLFEIRNRSELLLAVILGALDDSWLSSLVVLHVLLNIWGTVKACITQLANVRPNWVHIFHMRV
jgi:hypothetical protein